MSISKTKDLIGQLSSLERAVSEFSFEELTADEAKSLQSSFQGFRASLENHIYNPNGNSKNKTKVKDSTVDKKEVEQKLFKQNQFIAHVSHEIRTPLNSIIGFANLLKDENLSDSQDKKVQAIQFASNSLLKIINEVLEYSKISSGSCNFETIDFNLSSLINDVMFLCQTLMLDQQVKMQVEIDENVPKIIKGDPTKLSQVLLNLLGNSIKFIQKGYIKLGVKVNQSNKKQSLLEFSVADTGIGISKEKLDKIFTSYAQAEEDTSKKYGGTGLGLSISKEIIEKQKGSIKINSEVNKGTTITFTIPYEVGNGKNIPMHHVNVPNLDKGKELLSGTEILVFEDNLMNQHLIKEQLSKWGCKVYTHDTLKNGLAVLATKNIDLIFMDLKMPNLNGFEVSKVLRCHEDERINKLPIVAFSADFTEQDSLDCKANKINDFLLKPYTLQELLAVIIKNKRKKNKSMEFNKILQKQMIEPKQTTTVNLNNLLNECFGELEMLNELVGLFKINALEFIGNVKIHLKSDNLKEIALAAHKLKAGFAMLKANGMRQLIVELETNAKQGNAKEVNKLYKLFLNDYPHLEENIDKGLALLKKK